jgi:hypothetical protein
MEKLSNGHPCGCENAHKLRYLAPQHMVNEA